ncbi:MAG: CRTAC1 family protein [Phycisphaerales bacterium]
MVTAFTNRSTAWRPSTSRTSGAASPSATSILWVSRRLPSPASSPSAPDPETHHLLYLNNGPDDEGHFSFTQVAAAAGVSTSTPTVSDAFGACFGDYDLDGDLDLVISGWMAGSTGNRLFRNDGVGPDGIPHFTDVTSAAIPIDLTSTHGFSPRLVDTDGDLYPELLWAADFRTSKYFINNHDGTFTNYTTESGTALDLNGMGSAIGDVNNDGVLDWYVTSIQAAGIGNMLYVGQGDHHFVESSHDAGVWQDDWGWGAVIVDLDLDADSDIIATNGWSTPVGRTRVFVNNADMTFTESSAAVGINHVTQGRGVVTLDIDNDGDEDVLLTSNHSPAVLYRNKAIDDVEGAHNAWLRVVLDTSADPRSAPDGFGARIEATTGALTQTRWMSVGSNYLSQSELTAHFGLAEATTIDTLRVVWNTGLTTTLHDVGVNQTITVHACPADFTGDGVLDFDDVLGFMISFAGADRRADLNPDDAYDFLDVFAFLVAFGEGCP